MEKDKSLKKILIVSFEAGSAEIISELFSNRNKSLVFKINQITKKIFSSKGFKILEYGKKNYKFDSIFFGASYNHGEIKFLKNKKFDNTVKNCVLDHWVYYKHRINIKNKFLINNFYVFDRFAKKKLEKLKIKKSKILEKKHPILSKLKKLKSINKGEKKVVIFLNNVSFYKNKKFKGFLSNFELINYAVKHLKFKYKYLSQIYIKMHPANNKKKYKKYLKKFHNLKILKTKETLNSLGSSKLVIGNESMVLYLSYCLKIKNINITKNKKTLIPPIFCSKILRLKSRR